MKKIALLALAVVLIALLAGCAKGDETPPVISEVSVSNITETGATITWTTDEPATSRVEYGLTASYGSTSPLDEDLVTSHSITLSDLALDTTYHYRVKSEDASGNEATSSDRTFATAPDTTPPVISAVSVSDITSSTATVTWTTDELATSEVEYGLTTSYGSTATSPLDALVTSHGVSLSGLDPSTTYHYRVKSEDESDNEAVSEDYTFTTTKIFPDENLEAAIRQAIGKPEGAIHISDLEGLTSLDASNRNIADLTGLEYCTNLRVLHLSFNQIISITPFANLTSLTNLDLYGNQISNISPLTNLTSLAVLNVGSNQISNILPLANLTSLIELFLWSNQISDLSPLTDLTSLTQLGLYGNQISNISPLVDLTKLTTLYLDRNQISNISPLADLTKLTTLYLYSNQISDLSPLANLTNIITLYLQDNQISDITPLSNLTSLIELKLNTNQIEDITPIVNNPGLGDGDTVDLRGNPLSSESICTLISQLEGTGVEVLYDEPVACIAYIYSYNTQTANSYRSLLEDNDYAVTLVPLSDVATTDFSSYGLIIVASDTENRWDDPPSVSAVDGSASPIIGLGEGGYDFFGKLALQTGYPNGKHGTDNSIYVVDASHSIFNTPNSIAIPGDDIIQLYTTTGHVAIGLASIQENVVVLGRRVEVAFYPLTLEDGRYLLWGFTASPESMTQVGKDLFLNVVAFMLGAS